MNTAHKTRLKAASLIGLATLGGGMASMSTAVASVPSGPTHTMPPSHDEQVSVTYSADHKTKTVVTSFPGGGSRTEIFSLKVVGYTDTVTSTYTVAAKTTTNVHQAPGTKSKIVGTLKANTKLKVTATTSYLTDANDNFESTTTTEPWMKITSGPYVGKYVNTAVMKNLLWQSNKIVKSQRTGWVLTSTVELGTPPVDKTYPPIQR